ncbi:MAG: hypothetical protein WC244_04705 [Patescibacteria group bacterium]|jgi:dephospho-CoA kinase
MSEKKKIILGLVGEIASGKDTMADYLKKKYNSDTVSFSTPIRQILDILYLPQTRENMVNIGASMREKFGVTIFGKVIAEHCKASPSPLISLPNVRIEYDIVYLKEMSNFHLINIDVSEKIRYERLIKRTQNPGDREKTWEQFLKEGELATEITIREVAKMAEYQLDNNGSFEDFYKQIDELMTKIYV